MRKTGSASQLFVDGKPFLVLGGELGNSTASDLVALKHALDRCKRLRLNTVLLPAYWDLIEPQEGSSDFSLVQGAIDLARERDLRLVLLWFGTWKNSMSCYAPAWVKRDATRFERAMSSSGDPMEIVSPACAAARDVDARAFAALMRWLRDYDSAKRTVLMVQVENEVGMIPAARDHAPAVDRTYHSEVPEVMLSLAASGRLGPEVGKLWEKAGGKTSGSWSELFGSEAEGQEVFTAWQLANYVEGVAAAGKKEYPLPMFANAALVRPQYRPGQYPSGGPLPHLLEIWRAAAPSLDMICPDIYFPNFTEWCKRYDRGGNPLFIPETAPSMRASANAVFAVASCNAIGCGPFSIENVDEHKGRLLASSYVALAGMSDLILKGQQEGTILGLTPQVAFDWTTPDDPQRGELGGVAFTATFDRMPVAGDAAVSALPTLGSGRWDAPPGTPLGGAMILQVADEEFLALGMGTTLTFASADGRGHVGIAQVQEGRFEQGLWAGGRWLNGDETHQGRHVRFNDGGWSIQRVSLYRY